MTDADGTAWSCVQAFAGLAASAEDAAEKADAARVPGREDHVFVVATPSGGARSVRLELPRDWESLTDDDLLARIRDAAG